MGVYSWGRAVLITFGAILSRIIIVMPDTDTEESANLHCQQNSASMLDIMPLGVYLYIFHTQVDVMFAISKW